MTDWRGDLMDALIDIRQEALYPEWGNEMIEIESRIDRAVKAARAEAWAEGYMHCWVNDGSPESNPYRKES